MNELNPHSDQPHVEIEATLPSATVEQLQALPIPRLHDWFGEWCIEPSRGMAMMDLVSKMDLSSHVSQHKHEQRQYATTYLPTAEDGETFAAVDPEATDVQNGIAVIDITGTLMKSAGSLSSSSSTVSLRSAIRAAANDSTIGGIMLRIDSPGGTVSGNSDLADEINAAATKKPIWAFGEDLVASAALWLATQCDQFFANSKTAMIGSIGTVIGLYDKSVAAGLQGVKAKVYATGSLKGAGFPGAAITNEQDQYFQSIVDTTQEHFRQAVADGRDLTVAQVKAMETGGLFNAMDAKSRGLIDGIQSFDKTMSGMFSEIKSRQKMAAQTLKGKTKMATAKTTVIEEQTAEVAPVIDRTALLGELNVFVARFGADNGAKWFGEGVKMEEALGRHCEVLTAKLTAQAEDFQAKITAKDSEIDDLKTRLSQIKLGEASGVSQLDAEKPKAEETNLKTTSSGVARMAAGMKLPNSATA